MSAPLPEGAVHLAVLDDSLAEGYRYRGYLALCGAVVRTSSLPCSSLPRRVRLRPHVLPSVRARGRQMERRGQPRIGSRDPLRRHVVFGSRPVSWHRRLMRDCDTHRGWYSIVTRSVHADCGAEFAWDLREEQVSARVVLQRGAYRMQERVGRIEAASRLLRTFHPAVVIGLLQTPATSAACSARAFPTTRSSGWSLPDVTGSVYWTPTGSSY